MNKIQIIENIVNTIRENKGLEAYTGISTDTHLRDDLEFDSLDLAEFTVRIENETGIDVFADGVVQTVGDVLNKIS